MFRAIPLFVLALLVALPAHAQQIGADPLTVSINPSYPKPYQTVTVIPASTLIDLAASTVTVSVNGAVVAKGSGAERTNIVMGGPGSTSTITVTAVSGGKTYTATMTVRPADVALIIEPSTTAHPFYKGGTPVASEGPLRIIAIPDIRTSNGSRIAPENLIYTWRLGDRILEAQSGIGKSVLFATAPVRYRDTTVTLTVTSSDSAYVAEAAAVVAPNEPIVRIYRNDPLLGPLFERALTGTVTLSGEEETYRAVPYFFGASPALTWSVNGSVSGGEKDITLRSTGSGGGAATITAAANQPATHQTASTRLSIQFGSSQGLGIFGL